MDWRGPIKPTYIDLPEDLHDSMKAAALKRKISAREAYMHAAEKWLSSVNASTDIQEHNGQSVLSGIEKELPQEFKPWYERLVRVFKAKGNVGKRARNALWENLDFFSSQCDPEEATLGSKARIISETAVHLIRSLGDLRQDASTTGQRVDPVEQAIREIKATAQGVGETGSAVDKRGKGDQRPPGRRGGD